MAPVEEVGVQGNASAGSTTSYSMKKTLFLSMTLLVIIVGTIVGNILVCTAVCLVSRLRRPCNYLLVSLAVSDLCVALLVMPMALVYEVMDKWPFGVRVCDAWVALDVLSCTASILNLCMISVDRYWAITRPLDYGVKRTPSRMLFCVALVWLLAACISLPPLLVLGNEHGEDGLKCIVCQTFGYQIYATLGSFYIPLGVMAGVYYKIFQAAKRIVDEEKKAQSHLLSQPAKRSECVNLVVKSEYRGNNQCGTVTCHQVIRQNDTTFSDGIKMTDCESQHRQQQQLLLQPPQHRSRPSWPEDWSIESKCPTTHDRTSLDIPRYRRCSTMTEINDTSINASLTNGSHQDISSIVGTSNGDALQPPSMSSSVRVDVPDVSINSPAHRKPAAQKIRLRFVLAKERKVSCTIFWL